MIQNWNILTMNLARSIVPDLYLDYRSNRVIDSNNRIVVHDLNGNVVKQILDYLEQLNIFTGKKNVCL